MRLRSVLPCEIKVEQRTHIGGYSTESSSEFMVSSKYLDEHYISKLRDVVMEKGSKGKIWLWIGHLFHLSDEDTQNSNLVDRIEEFIEDLTELYNYIDRL